MSAPDNAPPVPDPEIAGRGTHPDAAEAEIAEATAGPEAVDAGGQPEPAEPDLGFTLGAAEAPPTDPAEEARSISHQIARELATLGPQGWQRVDAVFAMTVTAEVGVVTFADDQQRVARVFPSQNVLALVRRHRQIAAELGDGPWWRYLLTLTNKGEIEVDYDFGEEPFPDDHLFPPEAYRADLDAFPRTRVPVWLGAYTSHSDRQSRTPRRAAAEARATGSAPAVPEPDLPDFPLMAARWAVLAAVFVAVGSPRGPRVLPGLCWFEGAQRSGSSLYTLPGGRAVLSGGVWNAPWLEAVYNDGAPMPDLYRGAPEWVANPVLNSRAATGLLSFCCWWESGRWYRGGCPPAAEFSGAVPGMWTEQSTVDIVAALVAEQPSPRQLSAIATLVSAAEIGVVTRATLAEIFEEGGDFDIDGAYLQLTMAGVAMTAPEPMPVEDAIARVRSYIVDSGADTTGYPLDKLRADRISVGWMVYVPIDPKEISIGRAIFYVADDGMVERSSSSVAPTIYLADFERRFHRRHGSVGMI